MLIKIIFQTCRFLSDQMQFEQKHVSGWVFRLQTEGKPFFLFTIFFYHIWNEFFFRREVQMRLPTRIFSKFSTVSVVVIYGNKVNTKCLYAPYMVSPKVPHSLKTVNLCLQPSTRTHTCIADPYFLHFLTWYCFSPQIGPQYPINRLRNIAVK